MTSRADVREIFSSIVPVYDLLNRLLSLRRDVVWRRRTAARIAASAPARVLDLACGTGDLALALAARGLRVVGADVVQGMLARAAAKARAGRARLPLVRADAHRLPFRAGSFEAVTVAFGVRNFADRAAALAEARRVLAPGGRIGVLEFGLPRRPILRRLYLLYLTRLLPRLGALVSGRPGAYRHLSDSVLAYPTPEGFVAELEAAGYVGASWEEWTGGIVHLAVAQTRAGAPEPSPIASGATTTRAPVGGTSSRRARFSTM